MTLVERLRSFAKLVAIDRSTAPEGSANGRSPPITSPPGTSRAPITRKVQRADSVLAGSARLSEARRRLDQAKTDRLNDYLESRLAFAREVTEELREENL